MKSRKGRFFGKQGYVFILFVATVYIYVKYTYTYIRIFFIDDTFSMIAIFGENN